MNAKASLEAPASKELRCFFKSKASSTLRFQIAKAQCKVLSLLRCSANPASFMAKRQVQAPLQALSLVVCQMQAQREFQVGGGA